jgi:hypothetical protein
LLILAALLRRTLSVEFNAIFLGIQPRQDDALTRLYSRENFLEFCRRESLNTCCIVYWRLCFVVLPSVTAVKSIWAAWQHIKWPKVWGLLLVVAFAVIQPTL